MVSVSAVIGPKKLEMSMGNSVDHPDHYNQIEGIECIDVVENFNFNLGNAIKYIWRAGLKGKTIEDLEKAVWYVNREIERIKKQQNRPGGAGSVPPACARL